jgi:hypothetical protein
MYRWGDAPIFEGSPTVKEKYDARGGGGLPCPLNTVLYGMLSSILNSYRYRITVMASRKFKEGKIIFVPPCDNVLVNNVQCQVWHRNNHTERCSTELSMIPTYF